MRLGGTSETKSAGLRGNDERKPVDRFPGVKSELKITPRGLSRNEAAAFAGVSVSSFDKARRERKFPNPTLPGKRYDLHLLQAAMDKMSGISTSDSPLDSLTLWRASRRAN